MLIFQQVFFLLSTEGSLVNKRDLLALYLSGTFCHKTGTRLPSCDIYRQPTMYYLPTLDSRETYKTLQLKYTYTLILPVPMQPLVFRIVFSLPVFLTTILNK